MANWHDLGAVGDLQDPPLREIRIDRKVIALSFRDGTFGAVSNVCNHAGGPLGQGHLDGDYVQCPWHYWKFHRVKGVGEPGFESDCIPAFTLKIENGHLWIDLDSETKRHKDPHPPHPLARKIERAPGPLRVAGISTTNMDPAHPRKSTSEILLDVALEHAKANLGAETQTIRLAELQFRACEGFYSKSAKACTWPCSITQMDEKDQMERVYEAFVHWADVILIATPIRWGGASSLYYKMIERMNCIQNQITIANRELIQNKVAAFIVTGGQDNIQAVAGQMLGFFAELGFQFPPYPYIAHSRGWAAEDMERNIRSVENSDDLRIGAKELVSRALATAQGLIDQAGPAAKLARGGRKAQPLHFHSES